MKEQTRLLTQGLLESARRDGPSASVRSRMWEQIAVAPQLSVVTSLSSTGGATKAAGSTSVASGKAIGQAISGGLSAGKMLVVGALAGSALTLGVGMALLRVPEPSRVDPSASAVVQAASTAVELAPRPPSPSVPWQVDDLPEAPSAEHVSLPAPPTVNAPRGTEARARETSRAVAPHATHAATATDSLMHEAALVSQARAAIVQGHAALALEALDTAAQNGSHSLEPEELALRARALRLLGRTGEAAQVEETLKAHFPDSFLSR